MPAWNVFLLKKEESSGKLRYALLITQISKMIKQILFIVYAFCICVIVS